MSDVKPVYLLQGTFPMGDRVEIEKQKKQKSTNIYQALDPV